MFSFILLSIVSFFSFQRDRLRAITEHVEVDVDNQTEVFRVPQHNDVDAMEVVNDFREVRYQ